MLMDTAYKFIATDIRKQTCKENNSRALLKKSADPQKAGENKKALSDSGL